MYCFSYLCNLNTHCHGVCSPVAEKRMTMRILMVNTSERTGGAAIAANRLMNALCRHGEEARMLVRDKTTENARVDALPASPLLKAKFVAERAEIFAANGFRRHRLFEVDHASHGTDITHLPSFQRADVVHLHWVNQGMLSLSDIRRMLETGKPVVWTMHDMWCFTGICHYAHDCGRWRSGCGNCPVLRKGAPRDLSYRTFLRKQSLYGAGRIHFVACSDWLADLARQAPLLRGQDVSSVPNPIDTHRYAVQDEWTARRHLGLPVKKKVLLFVAYKATDPIKGVRFFQAAVERIVAERPEWREELHVVVVGREASTLREAFACPVTTFEYVTDEATMCDLYSAATLLCMPTTSDNLPNTIVEAMACGLPVVGFNVGGLPQMIDTGTNGYLAAPQDAEDFARGIVACLDERRRAALSVEARRKALRHYSEEAVAGRYVKIYEQMLAKQ